MDQMDLTEVRLCGIATDSGPVLHRLTGVGIALDPKANARSMMSGTDMITVTSAKPAWRSTRSNDSTEK